MNSSTEIVDNFMQKALDKNKNIPNFASNNNFVIGHDKEGERRNNAIPPPLTTLENKKGIATKGIAICETLS